ncbi:MAG: hypothetical protein HPY55_16240 [Firmicutes bacterium]|nr:hypothetical protein [Bacillota bacterium]
MARPKGERKSLDVHVTVTPELAREIDSRGPRSEVIRRDLERLYRLYRYAIRQVSLSPEEACLIVDALNGALMDADSAPMLWAEVEDGIRLEGLDAKWGVDGQALIEKLRALDRLTCLALVDAAERFWHECPDEDPRQAVRRFFLVRE